MSDLRIGTDADEDDFNDLVVEDGDLQIVQGKEAILQDVLQRLRVFLGEWFLDTTVGLPYFQEILVKNPDQGKIDALFINQVLGTPGVVQLDSWSFQVDLTRRILTVAFKAQTTDGTVDYAGQVGT